MKRHEFELSPRQLAAMSVVAALSPAITLLPRRAALPGGFWAPLVTGGLYLLLVLCSFYTVKHHPKDGLGDSFCRLLGKPLGGLLLLGYALWFLVLCAATAGLAAQRIADTAFATEGPLLFLVVLLGLATAMACGRLSTLARAAEIFFLIMGLGLLLLLPFSLQGGDWGPAFTSALDQPGTVFLCGLGGVAWTAGLPVFVFFFAGQAAHRERLGRDLSWGAAILCAVLALVALILLATFGPNLLKTLDNSFFTLVKGLRLFGALERMESVAVSVWVYADFLLLTMLLHLGRRLLAQTVHRENRWWLGLVCGIAALGLALAGSTLDLNALFRDVLEPVTFWLTVLPPPLLAALEWLRRRRGEKV